MLALYIILGILAVLLLILSTPAGLRLIYNDRGLHIKLSVWAFHFQLYPKKEKKKYAKKNEPQKQPKPEKTEQPKKEKKKKQNFLTKSFKENGVIDTVTTIFTVLGHLANRFNFLMSKTNIDVLIADIGVTGEDAAKAAINYGSICSVVYPVLGIINSKANLNMSKVNIYCLFDTDKPQVNIDIRATIKLMYYLAAAISLTGGITKAFIKSKKPITKIPKGDNKK